MITYNHGPFIAQAIDSVLAQNTNFDYEIVIGEDCSTDITREICIDYQKKYPDKIKLLLNENNMGMMPNFIQTLNASKGKYIAILEGDDYWIENYKLQKQVDILEAQLEYSMVFTARNVVDKEGNFVRTERCSDTVYTTKDVVESFIPETQTIVMRYYKNLAEFLEKNSKHPSGDRLITYFCSLFGDILYLDEITSVYRDTGSGVWSCYDLQQKRKLSLERFIEFHKILGIENNNLLIINSAVTEFINCIKANFKKPHIIINLSRWYKQYLSNIPFCLVIYITMILIKNKLIKIIYK
jgi:glycosyltransferase involved in cell wall biosynthesis